MIMKCIKLLKFVLVLSAISIICGGCNFNPGIELVNGYTIIEEKGEWCVLNREDGSACGMPNFYITAYIEHDEYILLKGIPTAYLWIDETEKDSSEREYYIVDTNSDQIYGPFESELQFNYKCDELSISPELNWNKIS